MAARKGVALVATLLILDPMTRTPCVTFCPIALSLCPNFVKLIVCLYYLVTKSVLFLLPSLLDGLP